MKLIDEIFDSLPLSISKTKSTLKLSISFILVSTLLELKPIDEYNFFCFYIL